MSMNRLGLALALGVLLTGCASSSQRAPIHERGATASKNAIAAEAARKKQVPREKDWRPQIHVVQKGETLYSIAFNYGFDYHELAELNGIADASVIQIGQQIRLFPGAVARPVVVITESKPVIRETPKPVKTAQPSIEKPQNVAEKTEISGKPAKAEKPVAVPVKSVKPEAVPEAKPETTHEAKPEVRPEAKPEAKPVARTETPPVDDTIEPDADIEWGMPTQGKVISGFSETANRKGVDIAGKLGQPVNASASGKVVYSGSGLRGYGKLVIIKHNSTFLSAYAHNDKILVREGETVTRGQRIAEMGNSDADQVKLHFEVRRFGKPVDPAKYLSFGKS